MAQVVRKGPWIEERMLGSGGFGAVHLWRNEETNEKLAIKRCRLLNEMTDKHKQRWELEIQIMRRLNHESVILAKPVPEILDVKPDEPPLLAMEYCAGGDLRRILNQPQSCCGLKEFSIRCLVEDLTGALEYLHKNRIIHRDLKPENIVLQQVDERTVYKVIDLGYAKELDQGSVCTSFVGTLQYLAPELFASQKYTCTVDYWSMGVLIFECIAGYRPFLPTSLPVQWHREICKKSPEDICAKKDESGDVKFYKNIPTPNRLSRSMKTYMEQWLQLMLRWDPKTRGGGLDADSRPQAFTMIHNILNMKIIYVLNVVSNEVLTYPILDSHPMSFLHSRIESETKIPVEEQDIILATGMTPDPAKPASQCWLEPSEQECYVYLFQSGKELSLDLIRQKNKNLPPAVQNIVRDPNILLPFTEQKRAWQEAVLFCEEQALAFKRLILSQRAAMLSLLRIDSMFVKTKNKMMSQIDQLIAKLTFFQDSLDHDMMFYSEQANNGGISSERMFSKWLRRKEEVEKFKDLKQKVGDIEKQSVVMQTKILELQKSPYTRPNKDDTLDDLAKQAVQVYQKMRQMIKERKEPLNDQKPIVTLVVKCVMWRDRKIPDLFSHLGKIISCKMTVKQLLPQVESCVQEIQTNSDKLISYQKERQTAVWKLLEVAIQQGKKLQTVTRPDEDLEMAQCRQDLCLPPNLASSTTGTSGSASPNMMQSVMSTSSNLESLKAMEDAKVVAKMFDEAMSGMMQEHEDYTSMLSTLSSSTGETSLKGSRLS